MLIVLPLQFISESLDVVQDIEWVISLGNAFASQYVLYVGDDEHAAMLHRYYDYLKKFLLYGLTFGISMS